MCLRTDWFSSRDAGRRGQHLLSIWYGNKWSTGLEGWSSRHEVGLDIHSLRFRRDGIDHLRQGGVYTVWMALIRVTSQWWLQTFWGLAGRRRTCSRSWLTTWERKPEKRASSQTRPACGTRTHSIPRKGSITGGSRRPPLPAPDFFHIQRLYHPVTPPLLCMSLGLHLFTSSKTCLQEEALITSSEA